MKVLRPRAWRWTTFVKLGCAALVSAAGIAVVAVNPSGAVTLLPPSIISVSPASGPSAGGSTVTVTGLAFEDGIHGPVVTSVQFGTARTTDFQVTGRHTLTVVSPPAPSDAKSVNITVTNTVGTSTTSAVDVFTYIPTSPAQPTGVTATVAGSSSASVSWRTPAFDGGSPITGYSINNLRNGNPVGVPTKVGVVNSAIVTGLVPGDAYSFTVTGITAIGTSTSAASNVVTLPASLPFTEALGYWLAGSTGTVYAHGDAPTLGSLTNRLNAPIVGIASTPDGNGYWLVASDGGVFSFGTATFHGSMGGSHLNAPIVGIASTPDGNGYWLVASDGGVFAFGSAAFHGSMGNKNLNKPIVGMAGSPGGGYWLVASDGGIFTFGNATYYGSMGAKPLNQPIVGMAAAPNGDGYWMVASDGGVFSFGSSLFHGSMGSQRLNKPIVGMASTPSGNGYWMVASDGGIFTFGDGQFEGSQGATPGLAPVVAIGS
jgi:hypothetical protein